MSDNEAAREAEALLRRRAGREELLPVVERAAQAESKPGRWSRMLKALRAGREIRQKGAA